MSRYALALGDVLTVLKEQPDNAFDALFCDPPYGLSFMGKAWDYDVPSVEIWRECLRVLKPGAPLLAFGGSRTYHRIAVGIEDAGFEIRDCLMWLYGKGFPKSQNVSNELTKRAIAAEEKSVRIATTGEDLQRISDWIGYGTALKPAWEPVILARKPLEGTMAANVAKWGVGGLAIDACRVGDTGGPAGVGYEEKSGIFGIGGKAEIRQLDAGRWPANLLLDEDAAALLDEQAGPRPSTPYRANEVAGAVLPLTKRTAGGYKETGGPSRFFYCSKVSTSERERGCDALPKKTAGEMTDSNEDDARLDSPRTGGARNHHPTLKPLALTEYMARLIKPPTEDAVLLVPFAGAGSEVIGALRAGWPAVLGIEREAEYVAIADARIPANVPGVEKVA